MTESKIKHPDPLLDTCPLCGKGVGDDDQWIALEGEIVHERCVTDDPGQGELPLLDAEPKS